MAGDVNDWIPTLMPEISEYLKIIGRSAFAGIGYCRDYAIETGRPVWGFKHPAWNPATIRLMRAVMPRSRFVFIERELKDCLKSAKKQALTYGGSYSRQDVEEFCRSWAENRSYMMSLSDEPAVLLLRYDDLVREPRAVLAKLADFTGLDDMDPEVLNHRVNTWKGEDCITQSRTGYFAPAELDELDLQIVNAIAAPASELTRAY